MIFDQTGDLTVLDQNGNYLRGVIRHDYLPFGEELFVGSGGRTTAQGYQSSSIAFDGARQKFTGYEADNETGLNYAQARYHSPIQGRFTGVDPLLGSGMPEVPQSWNRYSYTINNPLLFVDPDGLIWGRKRTDETNWEYVWFEGDKVGDGYEVVTIFYVEGIINGRMSSLTLNPDGPNSFWKTALIASTALKFFHSGDDYFLKGYKIGPTTAQLREFSRTGAVDMMSQQAFDVGLFLAGVRGGGLGGGRKTGLSMEGKAYELGHLQKHLPGTSEAAKAVAKDRFGAFVFNDFSTLSRVEAEIFARGVPTGTVRGWERFGLRFDQQIGTQIRKNGTTTALDYGEMKVNGNMYHVTPRTGPAKQ